MARTRRFREDLTYAETHRNYLPELYCRIGHRIDQADRDWTEYCHWCKEPLVIVEEVRDVGQDLNDKATTVTRKLAKRASTDAYLMGWHVNRPPDVQAEIERLGRRISELEQAYPIDRIKAKKLWPERTSLVEFTLDEWFKQVYLWHRNHHRFCLKARAHEIPVNVPKLEDAKTASPFVPGQMDMFEETA